MKVNYIGASLRKGVSQKTNRPYEIGEIAYAVPDSSSSKNAEDGSTMWVYTGYGNKVQTIDLNPASIHLFKDCETANQVELVIEPVPENPRRNWVVGFK